MLKLKLEKNEMIEEEMKECFKKLSLLKSSDNAEEVSIEKRISALEEAIAELAIIQSGI